MARRHAATRSVPATPASGVRPLVLRNVALGGRYAIEFDTRTAYDFAISLGLSAGKEDELSDQDRSWLAAARSALLPDLRHSAFVGTDTRSGLAGELASLVYTNPDVRTAADLVALVDRLPAREIVQRSLCSHDDVETCALVERALDGDEAAMPELRDHLFDGKDIEFVEILNDPETAVGVLRLTLRSWLRQFRDIEDRVGRAQARDAASWQAIADTTPADELIERVTGGIRFIADTGVRKVVLAPSWFARPYNYMYGGAEWRLFCYPLGDAFLEEDQAGSPPSSALRLFRALGDESRLRILNLLTERDMYLTEIAQVLELSKPTVKHHLAQLRAAGLVTAFDQGPMSYYSLRRSRLDETAEELHRFLG